MPRFKVKSSIVTSLIIALIAGGWILSGNLNDKDSKDDQTSNAQIQSDGTSSGEAINSQMPKVRVALSKAVEYQSSITLTGETKANRELIIKAETAGRIEMVDAALGHSFGKGELIARIAPETRLAELEKAEAYVAQAEIEYEAAKRLAQKGFQTDIQKAKVTTQLAEAKSALDFVTKDIERTQIKAPFAGLIQKSYVEVGDYLKIGESIVSIVELNPIIVKLEISENDVAQVMLGTEVSIRMNNGRMLKGVLKNIAPTSNAETRTFAAEVEVNNPNNQISAGMTAKTEIPMPTQLAHQISPSWLSLSDKGEVGVKTVNDKNITEFFTINPLADRVEGMWVTGIPDEVKIIVVGQEYVKAGIEVMIDEVQNPSIQEQNAATPSPAKS